MSATRENRPPPRFRSSSTDRLLPGLRRSIAVPSPAAGADWSLTVPGGRVWRIVFARATFTASAAVGNRSLSVQLTDGNQELLTWTGAGLIPASGSSTYRLVAGGQLSFPISSPTQTMIQLMPWWLPSGWTIGPATSGLLAADQWSAITVNVEELYESWQDVETHRELEVADALDQLAYPNRSPGG